MQLQSIADIGPIQNSLVKLFLEESERKNEVSEYSPEQLQTIGGVYIKLFETEIDFELRALFSHCFSKVYKIGIYVA